MTAPRDARAGTRCEAVQESISARLDGERPPQALEAVERHMATCADCRRFADGLSRLASRPSVRATVDAPPNLHTLLAPLAADATAATSRARHRWRHRPAASPTRWRRRARWAAALAPVAGLAVAVPLGILAPAVAAPSSSVSSPCSAGLHHHASQPAARTAPPP